MKKKEKKKKWKRYYLVWVFASLVGFAMSHIKIKTKVYLGQHIGLRYLLAFFFFFWSLNKLSNYVR
jgi:uncharacterized membrane-anchored protein YitT (DUF2179 family)